MPNPNREGTWQPTIDRNIMASFKVLEIKRCAGHQIPLMVIATQRTKGTSFMLEVVTATGKIGENFRGAAFQQDPTTPWVCVCWETGVKFIGHSSTLLVEYVLLPRLSTILWDLQCAEFNESNTVWLWRPQRADMQMYGKVELRFHIPLGSL